LRKLPLVRNLLSALWNIGGGGRGAASSVSKEKGNENKEKKIKNIAT